MLDTNLIDAAKEGNEIEVLSLIKLGANVNYSIPYGETLLILTVKNNQERIGEVLLQHNANVNQADNEGISPLAWACLTGDEQMVEFLLRNNADITQCDRDGRSPLGAAAAAGHEKVVELLLNHGADINYMNAWGWTPLFWACDLGHEMVVELLIRNKAEVNHRDDQGFSPLRIASNQKVVHLLLQGGAIAREEDIIANIFLKAELISIQYLQQLKEYSSEGKLQRSIHEIEQIITHLNKIKDIFVNHCSPEISRIEESSYAPDNLSSAVKTNLDYYCNADDVPVIENTFE
jgi:ankyrin repeat protein